MNVDISPQAIQELAKTMNTTTGAQLFTVMFFGIVTVILLVWLVWFIIGIRFKSVDKLEEKLEKLQEVLSDISRKMWSEETLETRIASAITQSMLEHERQYHSQDKN